MATVIACVRKCLGPQGAYLAVTGVAWMLYGSGVLMDPRPTTIRSAAVLSHLAPMEMWGVMWVFCGTVTFLASWTKSPGIIDLGYATATLPPLLWALAFTASWVLGEYTDAWSGAVVWAAVAARLMIVAGWPEPIPYHSAVHRE